MIPFKPEAYHLLHKGSIALSRATWRGISVNVEYCQKQRIEIGTKIKWIESNAWKQEGGDWWIKKYGKDASLGNTNQVREVLFDHLKINESDLEGNEEDFESESQAGTADKAALSKHKLPLAKSVLEYRRWWKAIDVLEQILRETVDGYLHCWFHLHGVTTYRSSSSGPNFQNFPNRDPEIAKIIRMAFRAPPGWVFVEADYAAIEVRIAACYHCDPTMLKYLIDDLDMHGDMALEIYGLSKEEYNACLPKPKAVRHASKNKFVFPAFYGSYWAKIAPSLWNAMLEGKFTLGDGTPFTTHLKRKLKIRELGSLKKDENSRFGKPQPGTFLHHISKVEDHFWHKRFPVYADWKKKWFEAYQRQGFFCSKTGFKHTGIFKRNDVINYPIQGDAFHCLLRSFYRMDEELQKRPKMQSHLVGQIHDSKLALVPIGELDEYLKLCNHIMTTELMEAWKWINVPIKIEAEVTPPGGCWYEKKEIAIPTV